MKHVFPVGWLQVHRRAEVRSKTDGRLYLHLASEDDRSCVQCQMVSSDSFRVN